MSIGSFLLGNRFNFLNLERLIFYLQKKSKRMIDMYFTDTPELRKFERGMHQKPNFDRRNDDNENDDAYFSDSKKLNTDRNKKEGGGCFYDNKNEKSYLNAIQLPIVLVHFSN